LDPRLKWALVPFVREKRFIAKGTQLALPIPGPWQFTANFHLRTPYVSVLYNQLKTDHLALIPFNLRAKGYTASVAHPWALAVYRQFSFKSIEIPHVSVLDNQLKTYHLALIPIQFGSNL
jgi:hypothetical protein